VSGGHDGELIEIGERAGVRFERRLSHPPERVWRAITERDELAKWFSRDDRGRDRGGRRAPLPFPREFPPDRWSELHDHYAEEFGVDPEVGRQALRERQGRSTRRSELLLPAL
jgi:hypothetical protein